MTYRTTTKRQLAGRARQDQALHLRRQGWTWQAVADELGYASASAAHDAAMQALARVPAEDAAALRQIEAERLDELTAELWRIYGSDQPVVSAGKAVPGTVDLVAKLQALAQLVRVAERRARMLGFDAPTRKVVEVNVVDPQTVESEIARLTAELAANDPQETTK